MNTVFKAPAQLPALSFLLSDLGDPSARDVARFLGVTERSVYGWKRDQQAPRAPTLALFYESSWGQSLVNAESVNAARVARGLVDALERENAALRARVARLEQLETYGAANAPTINPAALPRPIWRRS